MPTAKQIDLAGAGELLRNARRLFLPGCTGEPRTLHRIIEAMPDAARDLAVLTSFVAGVNRLDCPLLETAAETTAFFPPPAAAKGRFRRIISNYFDINRHIENQSPDIVFVPVTAPDAQGRVTTGVSAEFVAAAMAVAETRVAIISRGLPRLADGEELALDRFTHVLTDDMAPLPLPQAGADGQAQTIAGHVAGLIADGATIQTGIGKVPSALFARLTDKRGLRIHSGIVTQSARMLVEAGALDRDAPIICATIAGDTDFYAWLDGRRDFRLMPISHTHSPAVLGTIPGLVSVNSAIEVDLLGQVNAEWIGGRAVSAAGGLPDFAAAAHRSPGGLSVIALPATDARGVHSRIVAQFAAGTPVSVARHDVDAVVTEYGVADLRGKSAEERALALVDIAAPQFRQALGAAIDGL